MVTTFAGNGTAADVDGTGTSAQLNGPGGMVIDAAGNLYVGTSARVRKITPAAVVTTFAGNGTPGYADGFGTSAQVQFSAITGIDASGNLYMADNGRVRTVTPAGYVGTIAGNGSAGYVDGPAATAQFNGIYGVTVDPSGNVYVVDALNQLVRKIVNVVVPIGTAAVYSSTIFPEAAANDGSITQTRDITLTNETWLPTGVFTSGADFTATGVPSGLTIGINRISTTVARISFTGAATAHANANDATVTLNFTNAALTGGNTAIVAGLNATLTIDFNDPPSIITSITVPNTTPGTTITINGINLTGTSNVSIGGQSATFIVVSPTQITATIPAGASGTNLSVTTSAGTGSTTGFAPAPTITGISPSLAPVGTTLTITGTDFTPGAVGSVMIGGQTATFTVVSPTQITTTVPAGATGSGVDVTTVSGTANNAGFTVNTTPPSISSMTVPNTTPGTTITINGTNFTGASNVSIGGQTATFTVVSPTQITATIPAGASGTNVSVSTGAGTGNTTGFAPAPTITGISPSNAPVGTPLTITGTNFTPGAVGSIVIGGQTATFTVVSPTQITTTVPAGATGTGVSVTTVSGTANDAGFTVNTTPPSISSMTVPNITPGTTITINGTNFTGTSSVTIGGQTATFTVVSPTQITATIPAGASGTNVSVSTGAGTGNTTGFAPAPTITGISPNNAPVGTPITITGTNFTPGAVGSVVIGGQTATFTVVSPTQITTTVPAGATGSGVDVTTVSGTANNPGFTVNNTAPSITSLNVPNTTHGTTITINGTSFTGASNVTIGGQTATFTVVSPTQITATIPAGASGTNVSVSTGAGTGSTVGFAPAPIITGISPNNAPIGTPITITGTNFTPGAVGTVTIGGQTATFTVISPTQITTTVPAGATGSGVGITTVSGTANDAGFTVNTTAPSITSLNIPNTITGTAITINGSNFIGTNNVMIGGQSATFTVISSTQIIATIPAGASGTNVSVTTGAGTGNTTGFAPAPTITGISPNNAPIGTPLTITGTNFTPGAVGTVVIGGQTATFTVVSPTQITTTVPAGATGSGVDITTVSGTANNAGFTVNTTAPSITSLTVPNTTPGTTITINGSNFTGASNVSIGGQTATFTVVSPTQITATIPAGASGTNVSVTTGAGTGNTTGFASRTDDNGLFACECRTGREYYIDRNELYRRCGTIARYWRSNSDVYGCFANANHDDGSCRCDRKRCDYYDRKWCGE